MACSACAAAKLAGLSRNTQAPQQATQRQSSSAVQRWTMPTTGARKVAPSVPAATRRTR